MLVVLWFLAFGLGVLAIAHAARLTMEGSKGATLAIVYDASPWLLGLAWLVLVAAVVQGAWLLALLALAVGAYHLWLVVPRLLRNATPWWVHGAPQMTIAVANVFVDNRTPDEAAKQLAELDVDVVVVVESTPDFLARFDAAGGAQRFPYRVTDPADTSDYAVSVLSRSVVSPRSAVRDIGPLRIAVAEVLLGGRSVVIAGVNPTAAVDPGGYDEWREQIDVLHWLIDRLPEPLVLVGDLNTTRFRPEFRLLLDQGMRDAIDMLGEGLTASFKLAADGPLASVGTVARLDHALVDRKLHPTDFRQLEPCGSDHLPFVLTLAIHPHGRRHHHLPTAVAAAAVDVA